MLFMGNEFYSHENSIEFGCSSGTVSEPFYGARVKNGRGPY